MDHVPCRSYYGVAYMSKHCSENWGRDRQTLLETLPSLAVGKNDVGNVVHLLSCDIAKQECIPVGCVPSAAVAVCPEGVSAWGVSAQGVYTSPMDRILDTRLGKHHLSETSFVDGNDVTSVKSYLIGYLIIIKQPECFLKLVHPSFKDDIATLIFIYCYVKWCCWY